MLATHGEIYIGAAPYTSPLAWLQPPALMLGQRLGVALGAPAALSWVESVNRTRPVSGAASQTISVGTGTRANRLRAVTICPRCRLEVNAMP